MLANLIHSYDWSLPDGGSIDKTDAKVTGPVMCLKNPLMLVPKLRHEVPAFQIVM